MITKTKTKELEMALQRIYDSYIQGENNAGKLAYLAVDELARIQKEYADNLESDLNIGVVTNVPIGEPIPADVIEYIKRLETSLESKNLPSGWKSGWDLSYTWVKALRPAILKMVMDKKPDEVVIKLHKQLLKQH